jgi:hypothetical protein
MGKALLRLRARLRAFHTHIALNSLVLPTLRISFEQLSQIVLPGFALAPYSDLLLPHAEFLGSVKQTSGVHCTSSKGYRPCGWFGIRKLQQAGAFKHLSTACIKARDGPGLCSPPLSWQQPFSLSRYLSRFIWIPYGVERQGGLPKR